MKFLFPHEREGKQPFATKQGDEIVVGAQGGGFQLDDKITASNFWVVCPESLGILNSDPSGFDENNPNQNWGQKGKIFPVTSFFPPSFPL